MKKRLLLLSGAFMIAFVIALNVLTITSKNNSSFLNIQLKEAVAQSEDCGVVQDGAPYFKVVTVNGVSFEYVCYAWINTCNDTGGEICYFGGQV